MSLSCFFFFYSRFPVLFNLNTFSMTLNMRYTYVYTHTRTYIYTTYTRGREYKTPSLPANGLSTP